MGGRGRSSGQEDRGSSRNGEVYEAYADGTYGSEYDNLSSYGVSEKLMSEHNISMRPDDLNRDATTEVAKTVAAMSEDFPILSRVGGRIDSGTLEGYEDSTAWSAVAESNVAVTFNEKYRDIGSGRFSLIMSTGRGGYHFPNNSYGAVAAHELAHTIDGFVTRNASGNPNEWSWDSTRDWNNGTTATSIITSAAARIGIRLSGSNIARSAGNYISGYAKDNVHETIAEAVGDCYANGRNAAPLSRAIYEELRERARGINI